MINIVKYLFTEIDNITWDYAKILVMLFSVLLITISIYEVFIVKTPITFSDVCNGFAMYLTSVAAILHFKKDSIPSTEVPNV